MRKKLVSVLIIFMLCAVVMLPTTALLVAEAQTSVVTPVEITPDYSWYSADASEYTIDSVEDLAGLGKLTQGKVDGITTAATNFEGKTVKLGANITFDVGEYWYLRDASNNVKTNYCIYDFAGIFNGNGKTISNLQIKAERKVSQVGLFRNIVSTSTIINLTIDGVNFDLVDDNSGIGSIAGQFFGTATNCHVKNMTVNVGMNTGARGYIVQGGGLFGYVKSATVKECTATNINMTFSGNDNTDRVGALIGQVAGQAADPEKGIVEERSTIEKCHVYGAKFTLTMKAKNFGAFVGQTQYVDVTDCTISNIDISIDDYGYYTGGFVGRNATGSVYTGCKVLGGKIVVGSIADGSCVGGFVGYNDADPAKFDGCSVSDLSIEIECITGLHGQAGGFIGRASGSVEVNNCTVSGSITTKGEGDLSASVGGFVGDIRADFNATDCDASGMTIDATATNANAGGFVGRVNERNGEKDITLTDCTAATSVKSGGAAGGIVGYMDFSDTVTFDKCTPTSDAVGDFSNPVANAKQGEYEFDEDTGTITYTKSVCSGTVNGYAIGYPSIQDAIDMGATAITLLQNSTESFTLNRNADESFTFNLGDFTYNGVITVPNEISSFTVSGTNSESNVVITEPFKDHYTFNGWCNGTDNTQNIAPETTGGWVLSVGQTYHPHFTESNYEHLTVEQLHPDFGEIYYGTTSESKYVTFVKKDASDTDVITEIIAEVDYFDVTYEGLSLIVTPKANLDVGTYEELIRVRVSDNSTHGVTAKITIKKSQAVIEVDTSDIVVVQGQEWQLPSASTNVGVVKPDKTVADVSDVGTYTVTYSVDETDNYYGDSKQIKITVITDPAAVQDNLDRIEEELNSAIQNLNTVVNTKASATELQKAIEDLTLAYNAAIDTDVAELKGVLEVADAALKAAIDKVAQDLEDAKENLQKEIEAMQSGHSTDVDALEKAISELDSAYKAANTIINKTLTDLGEDDTAIKASVTALENNLKSADEALTNAIKTVQDNLDKAVEELNNAISQNKTDNSEEIKALEVAYKAADALINSDIASLENADTAIMADISELESSLANVKKDLEAAIAKVQSNLDKAEENLNKAIAQNKTDLTAEIKAVEAAYKAADALINSDIASLENADTAIKADISELESSLANVKKDLEVAIAKVQSNLDKAVENLNKAIAQNKTDLTAEIKAVEAAYKAADKLINSNIAELGNAVSTLETALEAAKAELKSAIDAVAGKLETAKSELNEAITSGDEALEEKLASLDKAYKAADELIKSEIAKLTEGDATVNDSISALEASLATVKNDLEAVIAQIQKDLSDAKAELEAADAELAKKNDELSKQISSFVIILLAIGVVSLGSAAVAVASLVKKRK